MLHIVDIFRNKDAHAAVIHLRGNKSKMNLKYPDKVYEPLLICLNVETTFIAQVMSCLFKLKLPISETRERSPKGGSITIQLVSSFTSLDSSAPLHTNNHIFSVIVKSNLVKLKTSCTVFSDRTFVPFRLV